MARRLPPRPHGPKSKSKSKPKGKPKSAPRGGTKSDVRRRREIHDEPARGPRADAALQTERLNKFLAHAGIDSRRACEELILQGRVTVDGQVVRELGTKVDPRTQKIAVDGQRVRAERPVYFAVNKPKGYVSTNADPAGRPRVVDLVAEVPERVYSVGRLDEDSTGLMILTNDGELANQLAHPKFGVEKVYRALVAGIPSRETLARLVEGVWLSDGKARARRVRPVGRKGEATQLEMVLAEGKNREVRRMLAKFGHKVMSLQRVAVGPISLKGLPIGQYRHLNAREVDLLRRLAAGESVPTAQFGERESYRPSRPTTPRRGAARHQAPTRPQPEPAAEPQAVKSPASRPPGPRSSGPGPAASRPSGPSPRGGTRGGPKRRRDLEIEVGPEVESPTPTRRRPGPAPRSRRSGPKPGAGGTDPSDHRPRPGWSPLLERDRSPASSPSWRRRASFPGRPSSETASPTPPQTSLRPILRRRVRRRGVVTGPSTPRSGCETNHGVYPRTCSSGGRA